MNDSVIILGLAFLIDLLIGDPPYPLHPVRIIGRWISFMEGYFFKFNFTGIFSGIIFWLFAVLPFLLIFILVPILLFSYFDNLIIHTLITTWGIFIVYSCFAFRDMLDHVKPVYKSLVENNLDLARKKLRFIVGRDVDNLNREAIIRASIESLSESFVDGFLSPIFWFGLGTTAGKLLESPYAFFYGIIFILIFRVTNTLDSMIGYQSEKYEKFGRFSARLDDAMNFIPARLSLFFIIPGILPAKGNIFSAMRIFFRDRLKSKSPNAAHSMSIFAGALEISLGGPASYCGELLKKPTLGDSTKEIKIELMKQSMKIFFYSGLFVIIFMLLFLIKLV